MAYKSLLIVVTDPDVASVALNKAISIARDDNAHLEVLCVGVDLTQAGYYYGGTEAIFQRDTLRHAHQKAVEIREAMEERLAGENFLWATEKAVAHLDGLDRLVAHHARFNDLIILPRPYAKGCGPEQETIVEAALFSGNAPTLVVPPSLETFQTCKRVIIAWNESDQSMASVRAALPALQAADAVNITIIDPPSHSIDRSDPGGALSQFLARHGIKTEISVLAKTLPRVSDVLTRHARDMGADMLVMGAYGHSRFRESILGGATRSMLEKTELPILMAHL
jgi:nucleotide-binding universal stress UspA family protein